MKNYQLRIVRDTKSEYHNNIVSADQVKDILEGEYNWYKIHHVHTHYAVLVKVDDDEERTEVAHLSLLTHDDLSGEDMIEEDNGEIANLYSRLGQEYWEQDKLCDGSIADFLNQIE